MAGKTAMANIRLHFRPGWPDCEKNRNRPGAAAVTPHIVENVGELL
jgi:hypothetical protein